MLRGGLSPSAPKANFCLQEIFHDSFGGGGGSPGVSQLHGPFSGFPSPGHFQTAGVTCNITAKVLAD